MKDKSMRPSPLWPELPGDRPPQESNLPPFPAPVPQGGVDLWGTIQWLTRDRDAYRARMEALVELMKTNGHHDIHCEKAGFRCEDEPCTCGLDALLAACERREGKR